MDENIVRIVFVDTANNSKKHCCYDPVKDEFFEADSLIDLRDYDEIYLDSSIFHNMWSDIRELLNMGKRVYYFRRPWKWRELREKYANELKARFGKKKTDYGDAYILSKIPLNWKWFREITYIDAEIRPLLTLEKTYYKNYQRLSRLKDLGVDVDKDIDEVRYRMHRIRSEVVEKALEMIPRFKEIRRKLRLEEDLNGLYGLAGTLIYLGWPSTIIPYHYSLRYLGLYKAKGKDGRRLKHSQNNCRRLFMILAQAITRRRSDSWPPKYRYQRKLLRELTHLLQEMRRPT